MGWIEFLFRSGEQSTRVVAAWTSDVPFEIVRALNRALQSGKKQTVEATDESRHGYQVAFRRLQDNLEVVVRRSTVGAAEYRVVFRHRGSAAATVSNFIAAFESLISPPVSSADYQNSWGFAIPVAELEHLRRIASGRSGAESEPPPSCESERPR